MQWTNMRLRKAILLLLLLLVTFVASESYNNSSSRNEFIEESSDITFSGEFNPPNLLHQESFPTPRNSLLDNDASTRANSRQIRQLNRDSMEHKTTSSGAKEKLKPSKHTSNSATENMKRPEKQSDHMFTKGTNKPIKTKTKNQTGHTFKTDFRAGIQHVKDQLIRGKVYLSLPSTRRDPHFIRELQIRMKDTHRALFEANKESKLPKNFRKKLKAMENTLAKGKRIQKDHNVVVRKLGAMLHSAEEQLQVYKKETAFLTHLMTTTLPKGLHCLPLRLSIEYFNLKSSQRKFPNQKKLEDRKLYHYALFSDNILATAVVINSTVSNAKDSSKHVFHIVTDKPTYAAMRMWFLVNPPRKATIQVQNIEELAVSNSSYSSVLNRLETSSDDSDSNPKFQNPKYLSSLNHIRFYLPEIFPNLKKILFLDDDIVVQKDLTPLWSLDMKGKVNGAVETCGGTFHRLKRYLNFSNPLISKKFDPNACAWAFGMNIFDLKAWKRHKITEVYHSWKNLNKERQLWKLGTLPPGLITFWNRTHLLDHSWHVLGLGYKPNVSQKEIEEAAVIHYNGDFKPWLEIGRSEYRSYWEKFIDFHHRVLQECNIHSFN